MGDDAGETVEKEIQEESVSVPVKRKREEGEENGDAKETSGEAEDSKKSKGESEEKPKESAGTSSVFSSFVNSASPFATFSQQSDSKDKSSPEKAKVNSPEENSEGKEPEKTEQKDSASIFSSFSNAASPFASLASSGASPFASVAAGASAFGTFAGPGNAFGEKSQEDNEGSGTITNTHVFGGEGNESVFAHLDKETPAVEEVEASEVVTGEEEEICILKIRAKLYRLSPKEEKSAQQQASLGSEKTTDVGNHAAKQEQQQEEVEIAQGKADDKAEETNATKKAPKMEYREMGSGFVKVNLPKEKDLQQRPRIVMRREGVLKLLLNAIVWETMPIEKASDKVLRFSCMSTVDENSAGEHGTFLLRLGRADHCEELLDAIERAKQYPKKPVPKSD